MLAFSCVVISCYDDKGSYDYTEVNEIVIDELGDGYSMIFKKDTLKIKPKLLFSLDSLTPDRYEYEWKAVPGVASDLSSEVIGTERELKYFMELYPGSYALYLKVRDKQTGLLWMNYTSLVVRTEVARGFLLIGDDEDGFVNVDMIAMPGDTIVLKNLLSNNGLPPMRGAKSIMYTSAYTASMDPYVKLWVATEDRSYYVNTTTFEGDPLNTFERMVYSSFEMPEQLNPVHMIAKNRAGNMSTNRMVVCDNGYVFMVSLYSGEYYPNPMNRASKSQDVLFKAYPIYSRLRGTCMVRCFMIRTIIVSCVLERLTLILESCLMEREIFSRGFNRKVGCYGMQRIRWIRRGEVLTEIHLP